MLAVMSAPFGELVKSGKKRKNLLGRELAALLDIDPGTLSRIENGNYKETPTPDLVRRISTVLEVPQAELIAALGYAIHDDTEKPYDAVAAQIARTVAHWPPAQRRWFLDIMERTDAMLRSNEPPGDDEATA